MNTTIVQRPVLIVLALAPAATGILVLDGDARAGEPAPEAQTDDEAARGLEGCAASRLPDASLHVRCDAPSRDFVVVSGETEKAAREALRKVAHVAIDWDADGEAADDLTLYPLATSAKTPFSGLGAVLERDGEVRLGLCVTTESSDDDSICRNGLSMLLSEGIDEAAFAADKHFEHCDGYMLQDALEVDCPSRDTLVRFGRSPVGPTETAKRFLEKRGDYEMVDELGGEPVESYAVIAYEMPTGEEGLIALSGVKGGDGTSIALCGEAPQYTERSSSWERGWCEETLLDALAGETLPPRFFTLGTPQRFMFAGRIFEPSLRCLWRGARNLKCGEKGQLSWNSGPDAAGYVETMAERSVAQVGAGDMGGEVLVDETVDCTFEGVETRCRHVRYDFGDALPDDVASKILDAWYVSAEVRGEKIGAVCSYYEDQASDGGLAPLCADVVDVGE